MTENIAVKYYAAGLMGYEMMPDRQTLRIICRYIIIVMKVSADKFFQKIQIALFRLSPYNI
jgi:hypothetical protein